MRAAERMDTENGLGRELAIRLEPIVLSLIGAHEELIKLLERHRAAISAADARALGEVVHGETEVLTRIESLDRECREAMGHTPGAAAVTITAIAKATPAPEGPRLAESAAYLRALSSRARTLQAAVREASESMAAHINGLMRQVSQRLSHAGTYGAGGRVESKASVVSGLDVSL